MKRIAHRGASGYEPENTLLSFRRALELEVDMVELDVYMCKTGELVVFHDDSLHRITGHFGKVENKSLSELRKLDAGKGEKIPTLSEVLDLVDRRAGVNIELKGHDTAAPVFNIMEKYVNEFGWQREDFIVSSFNHDALKEFSQIKGGYRIGILSSKKGFKYGELARTISAFSAHPELKNTDSKLVEYLHKLGLKVYVWGVNEERDMQRMTDIGVDGIFSDYPDRIRKLT